MLNSKQRFSRGQRQNTRSQKLLSNVDEKVRASVVKYRHIRLALDSLSGPLLETRWREILRPLEETDVSGLSSMDDSGLSSMDDSGSEGWKRLSWIWKVHGTGANADECTQLALRIEWCKARARAHRWQEECVLLAEEMRRVIAFFQWQCQWWKARMSSLPSTDDTLTEDKDGVYPSAFFLVALDQTIISTALPTIASHFQAVSDLTWIASAYFLPQAALMLFYGKLLSLVAAKSVFLFSIGIFEVGSLLCAVAPSVSVLIFGRAVSGVGSAGLWVSIMSIVAQVGGLALATVFFILPYTPAPRSDGSLSQKWLRIDWIGTTLIMSTTTTLLLALQWGGNEKPWNDPAVISTLVLTNGKPWPWLFFFPPLAAIAFGLLFTADQDLSFARIAGYQVLAGVGLGSATQNVVVVVQGHFAERPNLVPQATAAVTIMQLLGGALGLS
ncbi:hypothetical protein NLJ89_g3086 [Agrocybe chaxingu]|uniref:Major facilitator superfamily (MFS) profile domain-containing protein n=1 Tax=Agrocybe chaxingu TaxID=84603 RepID=A0A9W8K5B2_9AGAR|nr:hypothetical protein NLJ89_g3086 [Agrocybe chaxingu]